MQTAMLTHCPPQAANRADDSFGGPPLLLLSSPFSVEGEQPPAYDVLGDRGGLRALSLGI